MSLWLSGWYKGSVDRVYDCDWCVGGPLPAGPHENSAQGGHKSGSLPSGSPAWTVPGLLQAVSTWVYAASKNRTLAYPMCE